jgi:hydroxymethylbilane synthase
MSASTSAVATTTLRLGTRGSLLAKTQSQLVADELEKRHPGLVVELVVVKTSGDAITDRPLHEHGGKGLFTKEIEIALLEGRVDFAVHSYKDVPVTMPLVDQSGLSLVSTPQREDPSDVIVFPATLGEESDAPGLARLRQGAKVGTGSLRRRAQLLAVRPDLQIELIRGNIDTRLKKLANDEFNAIILAYAGLHRAGLYDAGRMIVLSDDEILPAPGQGALALQCRKDDRRTSELLLELNDADTAASVTAERALVERLGGDCHSPIAALARVADGRISLAAAVGARDGNPPVVRASADAPAALPQEAVKAVFDSLRKQGVESLLRDPSARTKP